MKIVQGFPPNIEEIRKVLKPSLTTIFTYGDTCYCPITTQIPENVMVHEETHEKQQKDPKAWWERYLKDADFRLSQELPAYRNQYQWQKNRLGRDKAIFLLKAIAEDLSGEMYGNIISFQKAFEMIKK